MGIQPSQRLNAGLMWRLPQLARKHAEPEGKPIMLHQRRHRCKKKPFVETRTASLCFINGNKSLNWIGAIEKRLLSWLRLLDARAVSAGGDGLFLAEDDSAINTDLKSPESSVPEVDSELNDAEAAFFIMWPAYIFFQKVQLFMGRVSRIDPWHRRRGTVEDETEVMIIAANISRDIKSLWQEHPSLMDHAVNGRLGTLLSSSLSDTITRSMRVYHANYYASLIHLHRVAYKNLPHTTDIIDALREIRQITRLIQQTSSPSSPPGVPDADSPNTSIPIVPSLPVNMLWPLLMLGVETDDAEERMWVLACIKSMEHVMSPPTLA